FFITEHHVDVWRQFTIHFAGARRTTDALPERFAIIEIIRNDCAVPFSTLNGFASHLWSRFRKRTENSSSVKPARAFFAENLFPISVARLQLGHCRMSAI